MVRARSEEEAREQAAEDWDEHADQMPARDYLETDGYQSHWDAEVAE